MSKRRAEDYPIIHIFRTPFPRSSGHIHLRLFPIEAFVADYKGAGSLVTMNRPRGYFGHGRDEFTLDGEVPEGVGEGVPTTSSATRAFPPGPGRPVRVTFNNESLTVRTHPLAEGHWVIAEFHY